MSLTGQSSAVLGGLCAGRNLGDNIARGYVTVDTVNNCTLRFPGDPGYFGPAGWRRHRPERPLGRLLLRQLGAQNFADGNTLVHIEAVRRPTPRPRPPATTPSTAVTSAGTAADHREPLATNFAARYLNGGAFTGGTDLIVWRDSEGQPGSVHLPGADRPSGLVPAGPGRDRDLRRAGAPAGPAELPGLAAAAARRPSCRSRRSPSESTSAAPPCRSRSRPAGSTST